MNRDKPYESGLLGKSGGLVTEPAFTHPALLSYIDRTANAKLGGLSVRVAIKAARANFGRVDYQITPLAGEGLVWISAENLRLD